MKIPLHSLLRRRFAAALLLAVTVVGFSTTPLTQAAPSLSALQQQKQAAERQKQAAAAAEKQKEQEAVVLASQLQTINDQINATQAVIKKTKGDIGASQQTIASTNDRIQTASDKLVQSQQLLGEMIAEEYTADSNQFLRSVVGSPDISSFYRQLKETETFQDQLNQLADQVSSLKTSLESDKAKQEKQLAQQQSLAAYQTAKQNDLNGQLGTKNNLLSNTHQAIVDLNQQQKNADAQIVAAEKQINALLAARSSGGQLVSGGGGGWYYSQRDPSWSGVRMGNSYATIGLYGCLITSIAMLATYYGTPTTPLQIARTGSFSRDGGLAALPPGLGISVAPSQPVQWSVVDSEIANNHPVIISLYLPSVGALNSDGSSHFIVIDGKVGGTYTIKDPISSSGGGYDLSNARSMKLVRPK